MPKLWTETVDEHRRAVRDAIMDTTAALVGQHGLRAVTMSQIAEEAGIGRATLYKYFPDVEAILRAWHDRQISAHLGRLTALRDGPGPAGERLEAVLEAFALISHETHGHHDAALASFLHRDDQVAHAQEQLAALIEGLIREGTTAGDIRGDVAAPELASYCLHALSGAASSPSKAAVRRLVKLTMAGLHAR